MRIEDANKLIAKSPVKGISLPGLDPNAKLVFQVCARSNDNNGEAKLNWNKRSGKYQKKIDELLKDLYT